MKLAILLLLTTALLPTAAGAQIYGFAPQSQTLHLVDLATGATTPIGNTVFKFNDIAFTPHGLIATRGPFWLEFYRLDPITGTPTFLSELTGYQGKMSGLATDANGTIWGTEVTTPTDGAYLHTVDPLTGALTGVGHTLHANLGGIAFDPAGTLYGVTSANNPVIAAMGPSKLITLNTTTGAGTLVAPVTTGGTPITVSSLEWSHVRGGLIASGYDGILYEIDETNGAATPIGPLLSAIKLSGLTEAGFTPGTSEDLVTFSSLNGGPFEPAVGAGDSIGVASGDLIQINHATPGGTFLNVGQLVILGSSLGTGNRPLSPFPGLWLHAPTAFVVEPSLFGIPINLGAAGFTYAIPYGGGAAGVSLFIQGIVATATAANNIFASTNVLELQLN